MYFGYKYNAKKFAKWLIFILLFNCSSFVSAQSYTFQRVFNRPDNNIGLCASELPDGTFLIAGRYFNFANPIFQSYYVRLNQQGDTIKTFLGCSGGARAILVDSVYNIYSTGQSSTCAGVSGNVFVHKLDTTGNTIWIQNYGNAGIDRGTSLCLNPDGSMLVACDNSSYPDLLKIDSTGNLLWGRTFGSSLSSVKASTVDNGYYVCGEANCSFIDNMYVAKTDSDGFVQWYRTFFDPNCEFVFNDLQPLHDGSVVAVADDLYLYKISATGDSLWRRFIYPGVYAVIQNDQGDLILTGNGIGGMSLVKADTAGNIIWSRYFPYFQNTGPSTYTLGNDVIQTSDGGYLICGYADSLGNQDLFVVKTDSAGLLQSTGLQEEEPEVKVQLWPNPAVEACHFMLHNYHYQGAPPLLFTLFDVQGRILHQQSVTQWPFVLPRGNFPAGACLYRFTSKQHYIAGGVMVWH